MGRRCSQRHGIAASLSITVAALAALALAPAAHAWRPGPGVELTAPSQTAILRDGGVRVAVADLTRDGYPDVIVAPGIGGSPRSVGLIPAPRTGPGYRQRGPSPGGPRATELRAHALA